MPNTANVNNQNDRNDDVGAQNSAPPAQNIPFNQQNTVGNNQTQQGGIPGQPDNINRYPPATMDGSMILSPQFRNTFLNPATDGQNGTPQTQSLMINASQSIPFTYEQFPTLNGFIRTQIGRRVQAQFLIGSNSVVTKDGYLVGVGSNYLLINEIGTKTITAGDFYNLKFISFPY